MLIVRYELLVFRKSIWFCDTELTIFLYKYIYMPKRDRDTE